MTEIIDKYLNNELTAEEKSAFEASLLTNAELRNEVESYKLIVSAYERERIKQNLQTAEKQIQSGKQMLWGKTTLYSLAAAACIIFVITHVSTMNTMKNYGEQYFAQTEQFSRGGDDISDLIAVAHEQIANAQYKSALNNLSSALEILEGTEFDTTTPEGDYLAQMAVLKKQEIQWLKAITYMKNGNVRKAKRLLKEISRSDSIYAEDARNILRRN